MSECTNCGYFIIPDSDPPRHSYGLRRCKRESFDPQRVPGPDRGYLDGVYATPKEGDDE